MTITASSPLLSVRHLAKEYPVRAGFIGKRGVFRAVDDVSFDIEAGETLGLVGESGSGKSTVGRAVLMLDPPTSGEVEFCGRNIQGLAGADRLWLRRAMQPVFQDPFASLNPRMRVGDFAREPLDVHRIGANRAERDDMIAQAFDRVGLRRDMIRRFPHELSGGQRQRVCIARAVALRPKLIVCDEPISALDVSIQAQVINLLMDLQDELGMAYLMISHDLSMVRHICHRVAVLYHGRIVEIGLTDAIYNAPAHPYTRLLLSSAPRSAASAPLSFDPETSLRELESLPPGLPLAQVGENHWASA